MTKNKRSKAARKATLTRKSRQLLTEKYGEVTYEQVMLLSKGFSAEEVADKTSDSTTSVAAVKANLTRGTYAWVGDCNF